AASLSYSALPLMSALKRDKTYRIALIGSGWWGMNILREAIAYGQCKVVGICDVDRTHRENALAEVTRLNGDKPKGYEDFRECITNSKAEIVIVGTPDHWHALPTIFAIEHGAHVYVEKPIGHTINEGKAMVAAARKHNRIVQVGTHRRVSPHNMSGMDFLRQGKAGKISMVKCFVNYASGPGEAVPDQDPPPGLNWDLWCGPAPYRPFNPQIHPKGFRQFLDYANGTIADWGIHWFDQVLWWTEEKAPKTIFSSGGKFIRQDNSDAPDTQVATFQFEDFILYWQNKQCAPNANEDHNVGCYFYGTEGTFHMGWLDGWTFYPKNKNKSIIHQEPSLHLPDHQNIKELWADFRNAIDKMHLPVCDIHTGHLATNMSLLAVLSYKLGRSLKWDADAEVVIGDEQANSMLSRAYRGQWEYPKI
ncbi:MAG: gfo/Idh/MocA family oxidoreductase, partial [Bacteroidetes bacterium]